MSRRSMHTLASNFQQLVQLLLLLVLCVINMFTKSWRFRIMGLSRIMEETHDYWTPQEALSPQ